MSITTEIVIMKLVEGIFKEEFINIVDALEKSFHSKQPGFIDTELLFDEEKQLWLMIQHWESKEQLHTASKKIFKADTAKAFVQSIDPKNVKIKIFPQINRWA